MTYTEKVLTTVHYLTFDVGVNYDEEDMPNDFPGREDDRWRGKIFLETGQIATLDNKPMPDIALFMKVCDDGVYAIYNLEGRQLCKREDYVPYFFPGTHSGDYLVFNIKDGLIEAWDKPSGSDIDDAFGDES